MIEFIPLFLAALLVVLAMWWLTGVGERIGRQASQSLSEAEVQRRLYPRPTEVPPLHPFHDDWGLRDE